MIDKRWEIPASWMWVKMKQISDIVAGGTPSTSDYKNFDENGFPWITPADLTGYEDAYISHGRRGLSLKGLTESSAKLVPRGTVLFSSRAPIGYCVIAEVELATSQGFKNFVLKGNINPQYTRYYLISSIEYAVSLASGTTFKELSTSKAAEIIYPLAPIEEQIRIVGKLDSFNSRIIAARNLLKKIPGLVESYKKGFLVKAFSKEPHVGDEQSEIWPKKKLDEIILSIASGKNVRCEERPPFDNEKGILKVSAVTWGRFDPKASKTLPSNYTPNEEVKVRNGDLLISRANTLQLVGAVVIVENAQSNLYLSDKILRLEIAEEDKPWILWFLRSPYGRSALERHASGNQESMRNISQKDLRSITVPWPAKHIRESIVDNIETAFKRIDNLSREATSALNLIGLLDKKLILNAFKGRINTQNKNDSSVISLLHDIHLTRVEEAKQPKKKAFKRKKENMTDLSLKRILEEEDDWITAQEAFRKCGIGLNATTEEIEPMYSQLRTLDQSGKLMVEVIRDEKGRKLYDRIKLNK